MGSYWGKLSLRSMIGGTLWRCNTSRFVIPASFLILRRPLASHYRRILTTANSRDARSAAAMRFRRGGAQPLAAVVKSMQHQFLGISHALDRI